MRFITSIILFGFTAFTYADLDLDVIVDGIDRPWAVSSITNDKLLVSLREGGLMLVDLSAETTSKSIIEFKPEDLLPGGQGGLLDIVPHPDYESNQWIYISYSAGTAKENYLKIQRFKLDVSLDKPEVSAVEDVFRVADPKDTPVHYAGRIAFDSAGNLLVTSGDGFDYREKAQIKTSHLGKILRMSDTGKPLKDNPFYDTEQSPQSYVYSYGHRNGQGLIVLDDGTIVAHEHGAAGGDEVNIIETGKNYGWPVVTNGKDYLGSTISPFKDYPGMELPIVDWTPSIAPSSMIYYKGEKIEALQDKYLITSLKFQRIYVLNAKFEAQPDLFESNGRRLRDIETNLGGEIFVLSDGADAVLYRVVY